MTFVSNSILNRAHAYKFIVKYERGSISAFHFVSKVKKSREFSKLIMVEIKEINESVAISEHANDYNIDSSEENDGIDDPTLNDWNYQNSFNWIQNQNPIYLIGVVALLIMVCLVPPCKISLSISFPAPIWILMVFYRNSIQPRRWHDIFWTSSWYDGSILPKNDVNLWPT